MDNKYLYKNKKAKPFYINDTLIGGKDKIIIAGPCTFGSYEEAYEIANQLLKRNIHFFRAGAFKSRTNPYSFQGMQDEGMDILLKIKKELNIAIITELMTIDQVKKYGAKIDVIQIGSRNMYNYELLKAAARTNKPILLKRGLSASYEEWLLAAEYILKEGNSNVILCERGVRTFYNGETRNVLDLQAIPYIKKVCKLPIIVDPSHASGQSYMVEDMSKAALVAGADGLIIETHINPRLSLCDSKQTIDIKTLEKIIKFRKELEKYED